MRKALLCMIALLLLTACGTKPETEAAEVEKINAEETYPDGMYALSVIFSSLEELYESADVIVAGEVAESGIGMPDSLPQSRSTVRVETVLKGEVTGKTVLVREETVGSVPVLEKGQQVLLFLVETGLPDAEGEYYIAGAFQGKFICREGRYFQQATESTKLPLEEYYPSTLEEITERSGSGK